jgi:hypothetical protein
MSWYFYFTLNLILIKRRLSNFICIINILQVGQNLINSHNGSHTWQVNSNQDGYIYHTAVRTKARLVFPTSSLNLFNKTSKPPVNLPLRLPSQAANPSVHIANLFRSYHPHNGSCYRHKKSLLRRKLRSLPQLRRENPNLVKPITLGHELLILHRIGLRRRNHNHKPQLENLRSLEKRLAEEYRS